MFGALSSDTGEGITAWTGGEKQRHEAKSRGKRLCQGAKLNNCKNRKPNQAIIFTVTDNLTLWKLFFRQYEIEPSLEETDIFNYTVQVTQSCYLKKCILEKTTTSLTPLLHK